MTRQQLMLKFANPFMRLLLRSPWHWVASREVILITVTGRKSGKSYTTPVNYVREDDTLIVLSHQHRTWWRNLRGGASVTILLRREKLTVPAEVLEAPDQVTEYLQKYLTAVPQYAAAFNVGLDAERVPVPADVAQAAVGKVMVLIHLPAGVEE
jgi:deazaflavin-dependent oxidoreductase (nitroreductase family)